MEHGAVGNLGGVQEVWEADAVVIGVKARVAGVRQPADQHAASPLRAERDSLTRRAESGVPSVPERLPRPRHDVTHHGGHDVALAFAQVRDQTPRVTGAHAHGGTQSRLHFGRGVALDLKPGEEAPLALLDEATDRTAWFPEQSFELRDQPSGFRFLLLCGPVRRDITS